MINTNKMLLKVSENKRNKTVSLKQKSKKSHKTNLSLNNVSYLQRCFGNNTIQRLYNAGILQAKLKIGKPNDKYEQEADRIADRVMSMPASLYPHNKENQNIRKQPEEKEE